MLLQCIIGLTREEAGQCFFDFFSIGHICFGAATFILLSIFYTLPKHHSNKEILPLWLVFILTMIVLIIWELLENLLFIEIGIKFEDQLDSPVNITTDIILGALAAIVCWISAYYIIDKDKNTLGYYIIGIAGFIFWISLFFIARYLTLN